MFTNANNLFAEANTLLRRGNENYIEGKKLMNQGHMGLITYVMARESADMYNQNMKQQEQQENAKLLELEFQKNKVALIEKEQFMKYQGITIHKNKNCNTWYTRYRVNGVQYYISARSQKDCYNKLKKALSQAHASFYNQNYHQQKPMVVSYTLTQWFKNWLELYKIGKVKESTIRLYTIVFKHISEEVRNKDLKNITLAEIITTINRCQGERQKQNLYDLFNILFKTAVDNEIIEKNIVSRIEKPKHTKIHSQALNNQQQEELINICKNIKYGDILIVAMYQGLRRGEVLGLTIDNIDFTNNKLTINKAFNGKNQFDTTKNKQSVRTMPLFEKTREILLKYKTAKNRIFDITNKQYDGILDKIKKSSTIENLKTKDMRATFITRCKELEVPKHIIQSWVGHIIGSSVTDTVYTSHNDDIDYKYIDILNKSKFYSNSTHKK